MKTAASCKSTDMLKTVCTVVTFLVITQFLLECTQALPPSTRSSRDVSASPWRNLCGDKTRLINNASILKGKQQKIAVHKTLNTYIKVYKGELTKINENIDRVMDLTHLGDVQPNPLPVFNNKSHKEIHRSLQVYIAIFDYIIVNFGQYNQHLDKIEAVNQLKELQKSTQTLLCLMEDLLNGTDYSRRWMKHFTRNTMDKILKDKYELIPEKISSLNMTIKRALNSIDTFMGEFEHFVLKRLRKLNNQNCRKYKKKKRCFKDHKCRECKKRVAAREHANNQRHNFRSHHSRSTPP